MSQVNDDMAERLRISGYDEGTVTDSWVAYLKARTGWELGDSPHVNDLTGLWFELLGYGGQQLNDAWMALLDAQGYGLDSDHISDRLALWWADTKPLP